MGPPAGSIPLATWFQLVSGTGDTRATMLGPEHGEQFALETYLLRLEWLRQVLDGVSQSGRPHLGLSVEAIEVTPGEPNASGSPLWTSHARIVGKDAARVLDDGSVEPLPGRSAAFVPPECRGGSAWVRGRCHPRGTTKTITTTKTWEFHFVPSESAAQTPAKGTPVRFSAQENGAPSGTAVEGRIDLAFREVWGVTVTDPFRWEAPLREMLKRDEGRPEIVLQPLSDHSLADDLFAVGTLWLAGLVEEPGSVTAAVRLRQALRTDAATAGDKGGPCFYAAAGLPGRRLPADLIEAALDLGNRLCGGAPGAFPGQAHDPVTAETRAQVYRSFVAECASMAADVRNRLFGFPAAAAELRAVLEGALRT